LIQLVITKTGKSFNPAADWYRLDQEKKAFESREEAEQYLKGAYGRCTKTGIYIDTNEGKSVKVGYLFGYRNTDWAQTPRENWIQRDWVEFQEVKSMAG